ncbi:MAG: hypothetical protein NUV72_05530 [Bauldia sp.]|nr:hypothetical protein [Bauldia sp.]
MPAGVAVTAFRDRSGLLNFYLVPGDLMMLQGVLTAAYFLYYGDVDFGIELVILGLSVALAGFGFWFASYAWRRLRDPEPPITIGPAGLHDRAISDLPIPWSDVGDLRVWDGKGGPVVVFDLAEDGAQHAGVRRAAYASAVFSRPFGYSFHVRSMGTDATIDRLIEAIAPYAAVKRGG